MAHRSTTTGDFKGDVTQLSTKLKLFVGTIRIMEKVAPALAARLMVDKFLTPRRKKSADYTAQLPEGARRLAVYHNLTKLTGWAWGDDTQPAVLLIHGWEGSTGRMMPMITPLLQAGYRVVALDSPGHGLSPGAKTNLIDVGYGIQAMIEQHGPFDAIVAHSYGAAATTIMLAREPHLAPQKLVLLSPMRDLQQHFDIFAGIAQLSPALKQRVRDLAVRRIGRSFESVSAVQAVRSLSSVPGLVIHDRHDRLIPHEVGEMIAENWHGAKFISTEKLGHRLGLTRASIIQQILAFLDENSQMVPTLLPQSKPEIELWPLQDRKTS